MRLTVVALLILKIIITVHCSPTLKRQPVIPTSNQIDFMKRYGYLDDEASGVQAQYTQETIVEAIINIQKLGAIPVTGVLDQKTVDLMNKKRCGNKDIIKSNGRFKRYTTVGSGWKKAIITYNVRNWNPQLGETTVKNELKRALDMWSKHSGITFLALNISANADIKVAFHEWDHGDSYSFDGPGGILGHAFFPNIRNGGRVHFDNDENWGVKTDADNDVTGFFLPALHELGHALGLGHSDEESAVMFPYYGEYDPEDLDADDVAALNKLYGVYVGKPSIVIGDQMSTMDPYQDWYTLEPMNQLVKDICNEFDSLTVYRNKLLVFKDEKVWCFEDQGKLINGYPTNVRNLFPMLPKTIKKIEAAYERHDGSTVFFSGGNYYVYENEGFATGKPLTLNDYRLPENSKITAAFVWPINGKLYLFENDHFWRYKVDFDGGETLDEGYPKNIQRWRGIPGNLTGAIRWIDGMTYFFKGRSYWKFNDALVKADARYPLPTPQVWFGCPETVDTYAQIAKETVNVG